MGGRHMLLLLYGCLSEERHVLSESERPFPAVGLQRRDVTPHPQQTPPSKPPGGNHGRINRMPPCATAPSVEDESQFNTSFFFVGGGLLMLDMKQKSLISVVVLILSSTLRRLSMILKPDICQVFFYYFHCWQQ